MQEDIFSQKLQNFNDQDKTLKSIIQLAQKIDQQYQFQIKQMKLLNTQQIFLKQGETLYQLNQQSYQIYNLCLNQLAKILVQNSLEKASVCYQQIFNGLTYQINQIINYISLKEQQKLQKVQNDTSISLTVNEKLKKYQQLQFVKQTNFVPTHTRSQSLHNKPSQLESLEEVKQLEKNKLNQIKETDTEYQQLKSQQLNKQIEEMIDQNQDQVRFIQQTINRRRNMSQKDYSGADNALININYSKNMQNLNLSKFSKVEQVLSPRSQEREILKLKLKKFIQTMKQLKNSNIGEEFFETMKDIQVELTKQRDQVQSYKESFLTLRDLLKVYVGYTYACRCIKINPQEIKKVEQIVTDLHQLHHLEPFSLQPVEKKVFKNLKTQITNFHTNSQHHQVQYTYKLINTNHVNSISDSLQLQLQNDLIKNQKQQEQQNQGFNQQFALKQQIYSQVDKKQRQNNNDHQQLPKGQAQNPSNIQIQDHSQFNTKKTNESYLQDQTGQSDSFSDEQNNEFSKDYGQDFIKIGGIRYQIGINEKGDYFFSANGKINIVQGLDQRQSDLIDIRSSQITKKGSILLKSGFINNKQIIIKENQLTNQKSNPGSKFQLNQNQSHQPVVQSIKTKDNGKIIKTKEGRFVEIRQDGTQREISKKEIDKLIESSDSETEQEEIKVQSDENGSKFILNEKGEKLQVITNKNGETMVKINDGQVIALSEMQKRIQIQKKLDKRVKKIDQFAKINYLGKSPHQLLKQKLVRVNNYQKIEVYQDEYGINFIICDGQKMVLEKDQNGIFLLSGKSFFLNADGIRVYTQDQKFEPLIMNKDGKIFYRKKDGSLKPVEIDENGDKFFFDENDQRIKIEITSPQLLIQNDLGQLCGIDEDNKQFIIDQNGVKMYMTTQVDEENGETIFEEPQRKIITLVNEQGEEIEINMEEIEIKTNDKGEKIFIDKLTGKETQVQKNPDGSEFIIKDGQKVIFNQFIKPKKKFIIDNDGKKVQIEDETPQGKTFALDPDGIQVELQYDENNEPFILDKSGKKIKPKKQFHLSKNGEKILVKETPEKEFALDKNGNQVELIKGSDGSLYYVDECGSKIRPLNHYSFNKNGEKIIVREKQINEKTFTTDRDGNTVEIQHDKHGKPFFVDLNGEKIKPKTRFSIDNNGQKILIVDNKPVLQMNQQQKFALDKKGNQKAVDYDSDGEEFIIGQDGQKERPDKIFILNSQGEQIDQILPAKLYIKDANGNNLQILYENGLKYTINEKNEKVLIQKDEHGNTFTTDSTGQRKSVHLSKRKITQEFLGPDGRCLHCGMFFKQTEDKHIQMDEYGKQFFFDKKGEKTYLKVGQNGKLYYIDDDGNEVKVKQTEDHNQNYKENVHKYGGIEIKKAEKKVYNENVKLFDQQQYQKFEINDNEITQKLALMDQEHQEKFHQQVTSEQFKKIIDMLLAPGIDTALNVNMYECLREIGANYKLSQSEFNAKIIMQENKHAACTIEDCYVHADFFFKKMILETHINRLPKSKANKIRMLKIIK